jgi:hypothetical protein
MKSRSYWCGKIWWLAYNLVTFVTRFVTAVTFFLLYISISVSNYETIYLFMLNKRKKKFSSLSCVTCILWSSFLMRFLSRRLSLGFIRISDFFLTHKIVVFFNRKPDFYSSSWIFFLLKDKNYLKFNIFVKFFEKS